MPTQACRTSTTAGGEAGAVSQCAEAHPGPERAFVECLEALEAVNNETAKDPRAAAHKQAAAVRQTKKKAKKKAAKKKAAKRKTKKKATKRKAKKKGAKKKTAKAPPGA